ncbi:MAG: hypothetical protein AAGF11_45310 [Myxococcota bacterium]
MLASASLAELGRPQEALVDPSIIPDIMPPAFRKRLSNIASIVKLPAHLALGHYEHVTQSVGEFVTELDTQRAAPPMLIARLYGLLGYAQMGLGLYDDGLSTLDDTEDLVPESLPKHPALATIATIAHQRGLVYWM